MHGAVVPMRGTTAHPGMSRLVQLLCPRPTLYSALDPAAQAELVQLNHQLEAFYNGPVVARYFAAGESVNAEWSANFVPHRHLHEAIPLGSTIVDLGCGSGHPSRHLKDRLGAYIGVDWSEEQCAANRRRMPEHRFITGALYDAPLPDRSADVVMSLYVIEHCVWPHRLLDEMLRLARPGGLIALLTPPFRHRSYLKSFDYGLSARPFSAKVRSLSLLDVAWHVYQHRVWYPFYLRRHHPRGRDGHRFLISRHPVALRSVEWFPDSDAVYISDTQEMMDYLCTRGASEVVHWPKWGYVLARKGAEGVATGPVTDPAA